MNRKWLELVGWCALIWGITCFVPRSYRVEMVYEIKGSFDSLEAIPDWIDRRARELAAQKGLTVPPSNAHLCASDKNAARVLCTLQAERRSQAKEWTLFFSKELPDQVGWMDPSVLLQRIREKSAEAERSRQELLSVQGDWAEISKETEEVSKNVETQRTKKEQLERDFKNRRQQLEILNEAMTANREGDRARIFEKKRAEVLLAIDDLKSRVGKLEQSISDTAKPLEPRDALARRRDQLKERIDKLNRQTDVFETLYVSRASENRIPDPEHFQIVPIEDAGAERPVRGAEGWAYAWLSGFLLFLLLHRNDPGTLRPRTYGSPRQVEQDTGMVFLGTLPPPDPLDS